MLPSLGCRAFINLGCGIKLSKRWNGIALHPSIAAWEKGHEIIDEILGRHALRRETTAREFISIVNDLVVQVKAMAISRQQDKRLIAAIQWIILELEREDGPVFLCTFADMDDLVEACAILQSIRIQTDDLRRIIAALSKRLQDKSFIDRASPRSLLYILKLSKTCWHPPTVNHIVGRFKRSDPKLFKDTISGYYSAKIFKLLVGGEIAFLSADDKNQLGKQSFDIAFQQFESKALNNIYELKDVGMLCAIMRARGLLDQRLLYILENDVLSDRARSLNWSRSGGIELRSNLVFCLGMISGTLPPNIVEYLRSVSSHAFRDGKYVPASGWSTNQLGLLLSVLLRQSVIDSHSQSCSSILTCLLARCRHYSHTDNITRLSSLTRLIRGVKKISHQNASLADRVVDELHKTFHSKCTETSLDDICSYIQTNNMTDDPTAFNDKVRNSEICNPKGTRVLPSTLIRCVAVSLQIETNLKSKILNYAISRDIITEMDMGRVHSLIPLLKHKEDNIPFMVYLRQNIGRVREDSLDDQQKPSNS